jgi:hypothetical protein
MYNPNEFNPQMISSDMMKQVDYQDAFFRDLKDSTEPLVRDSLFLYVAYEIKAAEAAKYKLDPKADVPFLVREAKLRGMELPALVDLVEKKATAFKALICEMELLRIEFSIKYADAKELADKMKLRDEYLVKIKTVSDSLKAM